MSQPTRMGLAPEGVKVSPAAGALERGVIDLKKRGASVIVALMAMPRGDALRIIETAGTDVNVAVIGKPFDQGEGNDKPAPAALLGKTLVVESANHLQTVGVVDLFVREGSFEFQDAAGIARNEERAVLKDREEALVKNIRLWEQNEATNPKDLAARRAELTQVRAELRKLETPPEPAKGSYFRFTMLPIQNELGRDDGVYESMLAFYGRVNEHNKKAFANREAPPPGPDGNRYVGIEVCSSCHAEARKVWNATPHANAYTTLVSQHKEFNLDCVSCHVTGYERPGGSSITHNDLLQAVQCEECHGAGALHSKTPTKENIVGRPSTDTCVSSCHHPPHVESFDPVAQMHRILGPGHGKLDEWPPLKKR
ncbi:MAG: multiheme c-type cytochrome [Polyangiaceae bacterium]